MNDTGRIDTCNCTLKPAVMDDDNRMLGMSKANEKRLPSKLASNMNGAGINLAMNLWRVRRTFVEEGSRGAWKS